MDVEKTCIRLVAYAFFFIIVSNYYWYYHYFIRLWIIWVLVCLYVALFLAVVLVFEGFS